MQYGEVTYQGDKPYDVFFKGKHIRVEGNKPVKLPLQKCIELIQNTEVFLPTEQTATTMKRLKVYKTKEIKNLLQNQDLFIIGSGPSLKGFDFNKLKNKKTMVLNHSLRYYSDADYLLFLDKKFVTECKDDIDKFKGIIFASYRTGYAPSIGTKNKFYTFPIHRIKPQNDIVMGLFCGELAGLAGLNLGIIMNAKRIFLLGFDLNPEKENYFFKDDFTKNKKYDERKMNKCVVHFEKFKQYKNRVFNCSSISRISTFDYRDIKEVLNEK
jgi:hypothetical protein